MGLFQTFFPAMEHALVYGRDRALEVLQIKQDCRKLMHELIKSAFERATAK